MSRNNLKAGIRLASAVFKRLFDMSLSVILLVLLSPVMAAVALVILADDGAPVLFRQTRVGRQGRRFTMVKFRTMKRHTPNRATAGFHDVHDFITPTGRLLRKTSLDELPQLINILLGQMSVIGPRPLIPEETEVHRLREAAGVYRMRPGITGLAQISGRDLVGDREKARLDAIYVHGFTLWHDLRILFRTFLVVARAEGVKEGALHSPLSSELPRA
jgi:lipopolysaccharide/colanic/teichoic acid biosynthesis glycosyltransferase